MSKDMIISHMNRDHNVALRDILEYYGHVNVNLDRPQESVELVDVQLDKLTLNHSKNGKTFSKVITLDPPMVSLSDARVRFINMAYTAADKLNVSPKPISRFFMPNGGSKILYTGISAMMASLFYFTGSPEGGAKVAALVGGGHGFLKTAKVTLYTCLVLHVLEVPLNLLPLLKYHRVPLKLYPLYILSTLIVGFPTWLPLSKESTRIETEKKKILDIVD